MHKETYWGMCREDDYHREEAECQGCIKLEEKMEHTQDHLEAMYECMALGDLAGLAFHLEEIRTGGKNE